MQGAKFVDEGGSSVPLIVPSLPRHSSSGPYWPIRCSKKPGLYATRWLPPRPCTDVSFATSAMRSK
jgi:hypothetical protein